MEETGVSVESQQLYKLLRLSLCDAHYKSDYLATSGANHSQLWQL